MALGNLCPYREAATILRRYFRLRLALRRSISGYQRPQYQQREIGDAYAGRPDAYQPEQAFQRLPCHGLVVPVFGLHLSAKNIIGPGAIGQYERNDKERSDQGEPLT